MSPLQAAASSMLAAAQAVAARGWPVFPCAGKRPRTRHGLLDATTDFDVLAGWWGSWPDANLAIRTGTGLLVLDIDPDHDGSDTLHALERQHGALPATVECLTGGGGRHLYLAHDGELRSSAGRLGPGLDIRADGGYVIAPPSTHASGRRYEWSVDGHPDDVPLASPPGWLLARLREPDRRPRQPAATWERLLTDGIPAGQRNQDLTRLCGHLLAHGIAPAVAGLLIQTVNVQLCRPALAGDEVQRIIDSIAGRERRKRRSPS